MQQKGLNFCEAEDYLGKYLSVNVDTTIYPLTLLMKACYWFTDESYIFLQRCAEDRIEVTLRKKDSLEDNSLLLLGQEFMNRVLDECVRAQVDSETQDIKNIIVKKAFSEALSEVDQALIQKWEKI